MSADNNYQEDWQLSQPGESNASRIGIGISLLVFAAIAIGIIWYISTRDQKPKPFVQAIFMTGYGEDFRHSRFVEKDVGRLARLLENADGEVKNFYSDGIPGDAVFGELTQQRIENFGACGNDDLAIFYVSVSGKGTRAGPQMRSTNESDSFVSLIPLLRHVEKIPATTTKLLLLDTGQMASDIGKGMLINEFPFRLHELLANGDQDDQPFADNLWVVVSHGLFQTSNVSEVEEGSIFGLSVAGALSHLQVQGDDEITVDEFYELICGICSKRTNIGNDDKPIALQIPLLMRGGYGVILERDKPDHAQDMSKAIVVHQTQINVLELPNDDSDSSKDDVSEAADEQQEAAATDEEQKGPESDADNKEAGSAATPGDEGDQPPVRQAWTLRNRLESRTLGNGFSPVDIAPHLWLRLNYRLVDLDTDPDTKEASIKEMNDGLRTLVNIVKDNRTGDFSSARFPELERLVQIINDPSRRTMPSFSDTEIKSLLQQYRDIYFRSRFYVDWCQRELDAGIADHVQPVRDLLFALNEHRKDFIDQKEFRAEDRLRLQLAMNKIRLRESELRDLWIATRENETASRFQKEQIFLNLLSSPLVAYAENPVAQPGSSQAADSRLNFREELKAGLDELRKNSPALAADEQNWATEMWSGKAESLAREATDLWSEFFALAGQNLAIQSPDLPASSSAKATREMVQYLDDMRNNGRTIAKAFESHQQGISRQGSWEDAIFLLVDQLYIDQQLDQRLALGPATFLQEKEADQISISGGDSRGLNLDLPDDQRCREFYFRKYGNPVDAKLVLEVTNISAGLQSLADEELASLFDVRIREDDKKIRLDEDFDFQLEGSDGSLQPLVLCFDADPALCRLPGQEVDLTLRIVNSGGATPNEVQFKLVLPSPQTMDVIITPQYLDAKQFKALPGESAIADRGNQLIPFVNRYRAFDFELRNNSARPKTANVELFKVPLAVDGRLTGHIVSDQGRRNEEQRRRELGLILGNLGESFASVQVPEMPAGSSSGKLNWAPPPAEPPKGDAADSPGGPSAKQAEDEPPPEKVTHGILCRVTFQDVASDYPRSKEHRVNYWFDLQEMAPEDLVIAEAAKDGDQFRVELTPAWTDASPFEKGAFCEIETNRTGVEFPVRDCYVLNGKNELVINLKDQPLDEPLLAYVSVNGYRGAYIYEVVADQNRVSNRRDIGSYVRLRDITFEPEAPDGPKLQKTRSPDEAWILKPTENPTYKLDMLFDVIDKDSDHCRIELRSQREGGKWVPIDKDQLEAKPDRQIDYETRVNQDNGKLEIRQTVSDHRFIWDLPTGGAPSGEYVLRARVYDSLSNNYKDYPFPIRFDDDPPTGEFVDVKRKRVDEKTEYFDLEIEVVDRINPGGKAGAGAGVDANGFFVFWDKNENQRFDEEEPPVLMGKAVRQAPDSDRWRIRIDMKENAKDLVHNPENIRGGGAASYSLGVRLTDRLGNETGQADRTAGPFQLTVVNSVMVENARLAEVKRDMEVEFFFQLNDSPKGQVSPQRITGFSIKKMDDSESIIKFENVAGQPHIKRIPKLGLGKYTIEAAGEFTEINVTNLPTPLEGTREYEVTEDSDNPIQIRIEMLKKEENESP